jgi:hypothetical protein
VDPNDILRFVLALGLAPVAYALGRQLRFPSARVPFVVVYACVVVAQAASMLQPVVTQIDLGLVWHAALAVAAVAAAATAWRMREDVLRMESGK